MFSFIIFLLLSQSLSDQLEQRTGQRLPETVREGPASFSLPPDVSFNEQLSARDAVAIALWNNTALQADLANLEISRADLVEARLFRNPGFSTLFPVGPKPFEFLLTWPIEELWQRGRRIEAATLTVNAVATGLVQNGINLIRDVHLAHADLWLAEQRARTLQDSASLRTRIRVLTERRKDAGDASGLDVRLTEVDARSTAELAQRAQNEIEVFRFRLREFLGMRGDRRTFTALLDDAKRPQLPQVADLLETALSDRPDLRAAELEIEASAARAKWQRSRILALVVPVLSVKDVGASGVRTGPGLNMDIPAFNRNQGPISRADAEVLRAARRYASMKDRVEREVLEAYERVLQAEASLAQLRQQVRPNVDESIRLSQRAFENGDISLLNVLEATRQRYDVELREIEARAAVQRARAELERAIGRSL